MGDKQAILAEAVPDLINGLLRPRCVSDVDGSPDPSGGKAEPTGTKENRYGCREGMSPEFKPVTDMHIGIVSSSLGNFGGDVCAINNPRTNDRGHLLNKNKAGGTVDKATPSSFLAWYPQSKENEDKKRHPEPAKPVQLIDDLTTSFTDLVVGVEQTGCGLEAQLESVYRFLIQPDPWDDVKLDNKRLADLGEGVDYDVLKQRADFLRPDSLVAVIMLTDEDDSSADPLSVGGQGWAFMAKKFFNSNVYRGNPVQGTTAPRGSSACDTDPGSDDCTSCGFASQCNVSEPACQKLKQDPNCTESPVDGKSGDGYNGYFAPNDDELNVRFHRMKQRYGVDPQYPLKRYVDGFTKFKVPDRTTEHVIKVAADGSRQIANYSSSPKCTNPLFAAKLPREPGEEYCNLARSTRSPDLVFFAVVGGVPNQLLHFDPNDPEKSRITNDDWVKILGRDPANYNYEGIDDHMVQSIEPRKGLGDPSLPRGDNGTDEIHGRDWKTQKSDLQYACTFDLPTPRTCGANDPSCDCGPDATTNPPLCAASGNQQIKAKAYPTIREFEVVRALGDQGIISSLCPIQLTDKGAPTYGYRPAVATIIDRLKNALTTQCLPQRLRQPTRCTSDKDCIEGETCSDTTTIPNEKVCTTNVVLPIPCLVLAQLSDESDSCERYGLQAPKKEILDVFLEQQRAESGNVGDGGLDLSRLPVCEVPQADPIVKRGETCKDSAEKVWCYVENDTAAKKTPAGRCPQALIFSTGTQDLAGARFSLQCIQQFAAGQAASDKKQE
jgi:hypothetical protein